MGTKVILVVYQRLFGQFCTFCLNMKKVQWVQNECTALTQTLECSNTNTSSLGNSKRSEGTK